MKDKDLKKLLQRKLNKPISNIQIFEEGIDLETQIAFEKATKKYLETDSPEIDIPSIEIDLFSDQISDEKKKDILLTLSLSDNVKAFRLIEIFKNSCNESLNKWATLSLQKSRAHIEHTLSNADKIYISSGLGGSGDKLRYFFVLSASENISFSHFQQNILRKEIDFAMNKYQGIAESILFYDSFVTIVCLIPIHISLDKIFKRILDESNEFGNFMSDKIIATNAEKFDEDKIRKILSDDLPELKELSDIDSLNIDIDDLDDDDDDFFDDDGNIDDDYDDDDDDDGNIDDDDDDDDDSFF